jgi:hypothetical protein
MVSEANTQGQGHHREWASREDAPLSQLAFAVWAKYDGTRIVVCAAPLPSLYTFPRRISLVLAVVSCGQATRFNTIRVKQ